MKSLLNYGYHINFFDSAGVSKFCGVVTNCVHTEDGVLSVEDIQCAIDTKPRWEICAQVRLVSIENTINSHQGKVFPLTVQKDIFKHTRNNNINLHVDGARIFNAHVATGIPLSEYAKYTDTLSFCFSKGLGAPFGSMLLGRKDTIEKAKKYQTWLGSGYHQIGFQARAALYVLQNNIPRLNEDHRLTCLLFKKLSNIEGIKLSNSVETNMLGFDISSLQVSNEVFLDECARNGVLLFPWLKHKIRAVIHLGVDERDVQRVYNVVSSTVQKLTAHRLE